MLDVDLLNFTHTHRITEAKLLGVVFSSSLQFDTHVDFVFQRNNQRSYFCLSSAQLNIVFYAIILSRIYACVTVTVRTYFK
jgi:hypothetical protein